MVTGGMPLVLIWNWDYLTMTICHGLSPNTWRIGLMPVKIAGSEELCRLRIKTASQMIRSDNRYQCATEQTDAIKMIGHVLSTDWPKVESNGEKIKRTTEQKMDGLYWRGSTTNRCNKVWKNSRKTTNDTERHCSRQTTVEVPNGGIYGWNLLDDDYLT